MWLWYKIIMTKDTVLCITIPIFNTCRKRINMIMEKCSNLLKIAYPFSITLL
jgi:hypothetical protein